MHNFWDGPLPKAGERTVKDMESVLYDTKSGMDPNTPLYFMYRALSKNERDAKWLEDNSLRYDITVIPANKVGAEFVKTKGHYHPNAPCGRAYPELYQVLGGEAHFLLQNRNLSDICVIRATAGDVVLIPSGYGHVTINPSRDRLVMANIVSCEFESEYEFYGEMHGAAYYELESGFIRNPHYPEGLPDIRVIDSFEIPELGLKHGVPIYSFIGGDILPKYLNVPKILDTVKAPQYQRFLKNQPKIV